MVPAPGLQGKSWKIPRPASGEAYGSGTVISPVGHQAAVSFETPIYVQAET